MTAACEFCCLQLIHCYFITYEPARGGRDGEAENTHVIIVIIALRTYHMLRTLSEDIFHSASIKKLWIAKLYAWYKKVLKNMNYLFRDDASW